MTYLKHILFYNLLNAYFDDSFKLWLSFSKAILYVGFYVMVLIWIHNFLLFINQEQKITDYHCT